MNTNSGQTGQENYEITSSFLIDMDAIDTIDIEELNVDERIAEKEAEIRERIRQLEERKNRRKRKFSDLSDEEIKARINELREEMAWHAHQENGMEYHEDDTLVEEYNELEAEITRRQAKKDNPFSDMSDEDIARRLIELDEELRYRTHQENGTEYHDDDLYEEYRQISAEMQRRRGLISEESSKEDEEIERLLQVERENLERIENFKAEYEETKTFMIRYDAARREQERRQQERINQFYGVTDAELEERLSALREELKYRSGYENGMEYHEDDTSYEEMQAVEAEIERRRNQQTIEDTEFTNMSDDELNQVVSDMDEEYLFRVHKQNGMEGNFDDSILDSDIDRRKMSINGERTDDLIIGPRSEGFQFSNGEYVSLSEIREAIGAEFERLGDSEVVRCHRTGEVVNVDQMYEAIVAAAREESRIELSEGNPTLQYSNRRVGINDRRDTSDNFVDRGTVRLPVDDIPEDYFIRTQIVRDIISSYDRTKEKANEIKPQQKVIIPTMPIGLPPGPSAPLALPPKGGSSATRPTNDPTGPTNDPTGPTNDPTGPTNDPTGPTNDPTGPTNDPTGPTNDPTGPTNDPTGPTNTPDEPVVPPLRPPREPNVPFQYDKNEEARLIRDMLDRYYGNRKKERLYRKAMETYKSHIITDEEGFKTVEDFPEREYIEREFHLEEYKERIEAYSRFERGDVSRYEKLLQDYETIGKPFPLKADGTEYTREEKIRILAQEDAHYIETFNDNYNSYANTYLNLKTLGKDGEKKPYAKLEPIRDRTGRIRIKRILANAGKAVLNVGIGAMNIFKVYPSKFIGTFIAAPIQKLFHNSEKKAAGAYTNKRSHRYAQRRDLFEREYQQALVEKYRREGRNPQDIKLSDRLKITFASRFKALFKWKEGNQKVLSLGAANIRAGLLEQARIEHAKGVRRAVLEDEVERQTERATSINERLAEDPPEAEREALTAALEETNEVITRSNRDLRRIPTERTRGFRTNQTDAVSSEVHDKANKDNITHVVHGVKLAGRVIIAKIAIPKIMEQITTTTTIKNPDKIVTVETGNIDPKKVEELTLGDLIANGDRSSLDYDALGAIDHKAVFTDDYVRGIHFKLNGKYLSGTDGIGYDPFKAPISTMKLPSVLSKDTKLCDAVAAVYNATEGVNNPLTSTQIAEMISRSPEAAQEFFGGTDIWLSELSKGIATGWQDGFTTNSFDLIEKVDKVISGGYSTVTNTVDVINPGAVATVAGLAVGQLGDAYDEMRKTDSLEEMFETGASKKSPEEIPEVQRTTREPRRTRDHTGVQNLWGFTGTKDGDYATLYNEEDMAEDAEREAGGRGI